MQVKLERSFWESKLEINDNVVNFAEISHDYELHKTTKKHIELSNVPTSFVELLENHYPGLPQATIKHHRQRTYFPFNNPCWRG